MSSAPVSRIADCVPLFAEARGDIAVSFEFFPPKTEKMEETLWESVKEDIKALLSPEVERLFMERAGSTGEHLLDLDVGSEADDAQERAKIGGYVDEIEERLGRLNKIARERNEVLKDLKEKVCFFGSYPTGSVADRRDLRFKPMMCPTFCS